MAMLHKNVEKDNAKKEKKDGNARKAVLEDLFYDFYENRGRVYRMNFFRGIFFAFGSVLGGTVLIAILIWVLSLLVDLPGGVGNFIQFIVDTVQNKK